MEAHDKLIQEILNDTYLVNELKKIDKKDFISIHINIGMYFRNKYLWKNKSYKKDLFKYYKTNQVDTVSYKILNEILDLIQVQSSMPSK